KCERRRTLEREPEQVDDAVEWIKVRRPSDRCPPLLRSLKAVGEHAELEARRAGEREDRRRHKPSKRAEREGAYSAQAEPARAHKHEHRRACRRNGPVYLRRCCQPQKQAAERERS